VVLDTKEVVEFFGLLRGSPQFEMDGMVILDTHHRQDFAMGGRDNTNFERRHNKHGVLGCVFVYFWTLRGKIGCFGCISVSFWAVIGSPTVLDGWYGGPRHRGGG